MLVNIFMLVVFVFVGYVFYAIYKMAMGSSGSAPMPKYNFINEDKRPNGLNIGVLKKGSGPGVNPRSTITVHYRAKLKNGKEVDSSFKKGGPTVFKMGCGQLIKGWEEGLIGMQVGEKRILVVPSSLAYGSQGSADIPKGADLNFEIELLSIS